ncbi:general stress protein [Citricoccus sp.]|uniref:general stress protein n=1 Tax=Citricoccus sp. TaxID=1978372 RepID=UPI0026271AEE|nr:general stress protein [Citricoccus sp.]HRO29694.1 hypothetical protein [Citricoccus sp.]
MSMLFGPASSDPAASGLPRGEVLGTYDSYADARKVVDRLAEQDFDVRTVSIVGVDLRTVERIRHRQTYASVALRSALQGAFFGLMLGILMSLIDPAGTGPQMLYTVGLGVGIWVLFGVIGHAIRKGKGFDSVQQLVPARFDVVCEFASAATARQILGGAPAPSPAPTAAPAPAQQPPGPAPSGPTAPVGPATPPTGTGGTGREPASAPPAPTADSAPAPAPASAATPASAPARTHHFPDLPDGRPQYGVRLPEEQAQALREQMLKDHSGAGRSGNTPGAFAAPDYGRRGSGRRRDPDRPLDGVPAPDAGSGTASEPPSVPAAGEGTAAGTGPASGTTEGRFARPRYGRHAERPAGETGAEPGAGPDTVPPARDDDPA